jgi:hypothetical protein
VIRGEDGSSLRRSSMIGSKSMVSQRNCASGSWASSRQNVVCSPSARATTVARGWSVERQRAHRHLLAPAAELVEVEVDGVHQLDRHRILDDRVRAAGLRGATVQSQQGGLGHPGQGAGVDAVVVGSVHHTEPTEFRDQTR